MSLSAFIRDHHEEIISEFAVFAKTLMPAGTDMTEAELRDHAEDILTAAVEDISTPQTGEEQSHKSQGRGSAKAMQASGKLHADDRIQHGFTLRAVLAEFRALRATVLRLYEESGASDLSDVRRFNEAVDEALTESMDRFAVQTDLFRDHSSACSATICAPPSRPSPWAPRFWPRPRTIRSGEVEWWRASSTARNAWSG
jgi:hypothetical protein